ncbi:MAG: hypothetical protein ACYCW6_22485 [Candidatus Xenobia bacterium]
MSSSNSPSELLEVLRHASPSDLEAETALWQLRQIGPTAVDLALPLLQEGGNPDMRDALAESLTMIFDDWEDDVRAANLAQELARIYAAATERSERELYAGLLADLRHEAILPSLTVAARHAGVNQEEYETLRDAIERLGGKCPEIYFDEAGQAWEVDDDGAIHCLLCGEITEPAIDGTLQHACPKATSAT